MPRVKSKPTKKGVNKSAKKGVNKSAKKGAGTEMYSTPKKKPCSKRSGSYRSLPSPASTVTASVSSSSPMSMSSSGSKSTSRSKRDLSALKALTLADPSSAQSKKKRAMPSARAKSPMKRDYIHTTAKSARSAKSAKSAKLAVDSESDVEEEVSPFDINWLTRSGIMNALAKCLHSSEYEDKDFSDSTLVLIKTFTPSDIRCCYASSAQEAGSNMASLGLDKLKTKAQLAPAFARLIVDTINAKEDLHSVELPDNIMIK